VIVAPETLLDLLPRLRAGGAELDGYLEALARRFAEVEPLVEAFLPEEGRFERLRRDVRELEARWPDPASRPPLFGLPLAVKDIFHVEGFVTRAGSRLPPEILQGGESAAVTLLRRAGALILGKTVTTEFAYFAPGPTHNPHDLERTPGGSSSGSAAAVAAGLSPLALGTQTIGSIGRPASFCGVVGVKPSFGRVPTGGVIPLAPSVDHVGFFTADVAGAALAARILCERWREVDGLGVPSIGVPDGPYLERARPEALAAFEATLERLASAGVRVTRVPVMRDFQSIADRHRALVAAEAAAVHAEWYGLHPDLYRRKTIDLLEQGALVGAAELERAAVGTVELRQQLARAAGEHGVDVWASPAATGPAPAGRCGTGDPIMNLPWTHAGVPTAVLPAEPVDGLPMGLQLAAGWNDDERLLGWARRVEVVLCRQL
jgi:Asp-tRNA(Asn)/Glu-tRNA(Gln) amidotransferase A subunit family amidase